MEDIPEFDSLMSAMDRGLTLIVKMPLPAAYCALGRGIIKKIVTCRQKVTVF